MLSHRPERCPQLEEDAGTPAPSPHLMAVCPSRDAGPGWEVIEAAAVAVHIWDHFLSVVDFKTVFCVDDKNWYVTIRQTADR